MVGDGASSVLSALVISVMVLSIALVLSVLVSTMMDVMRSVCADGSTAGVSSDDDE